MNQSTQENKHVLYMPGQFDEKARINDKEEERIGIPLEPINKEERNLRSAKDDR